MYEIENNRAVVMRSLSRKDAVSAAAALLPSRFYVRKTEITSRPTTKVMLIDSWTEFMVMPLFKKSKASSARGGGFPGSNCNLGRGDRNEQKF